MLVFGSQVKSLRENRHFFVCLLSDETLFFYHLEKPPLNSAQIREFLGKIGLGGLELLLGTLMELLPREPNLELMEKVQMDGQFVTGYGGFP